MTNKNYTAENCMIYVDIDNGNWGISPNAQLIHTNMLTDEEFYAIVEGTDEQRIAAFTTAKARSRQEPPKPY